MPALAEAAADAARGYGWSVCRDVNPYRTGKRRTPRLSPIEKRDRRIVYTDFEDERGGEVEVVLQAFMSAGDFERFRAKARQFLKAITSPCRNCVPIGLSHPPTSPSLNGC